MAKDKKKGLFGKAIDSLTSHDEKEALDKAKKEKEAAYQKASQASNEAAKAKIAANEAKKRAAEAAKKPKSIVEHEVAADETLGHIAQKYYKHATKPYYMLIYEANKAVIGDNPNVIKPGMKLSIPELPDDMK